MHADRQTAAHHLGQLFGEPGRHFRRVGIDDVATVIGFDAGTRQRDNVGGLQDGAGVRDSTSKDSSSLQLKLGSTAQDIATALAALRLPASEIAAFFEALREAGALVAEVRVR